MAALRGTLHVRAAELTAAHGEAAASATARQAAAEELGALRAELEKVMRYIAHVHMSSSRTLRCSACTDEAQARTAAHGIDALSKDLVLSRVRELDVAALRTRAETAEAGLVRSNTLQASQHSRVVNLHGTAKLPSMCRQTPWHGVLMLSGSDV